MLCVAASRALRLIVILGVVGHQVLWSPPMAMAGDPILLLGHTHVADHLPPGTTAFVLVDLERCRDADPSLDDKWLGLILESIAQRFHVEQYGLSLDSGISSLVYFEYQIDGAERHGWLVEGHAPRLDLPESRERRNRIRDFGDGSFGVGDPEVLDDLERGGGSLHQFREPLRWVDPTSAIAGASSSSVRLPFHTYKGIVRRRLPGTSFALHVEFEEGLRLKGEVRTAGDANEADGRAFVASILEFLKPAGSFGPSGEEVARTARIAVSGDSVTVDAAIPRASLLTYGEQLGQWSAQGDGNRMSVARGGHAAELLPDGTVILAGGFDGRRGLSTVEFYDPASDRFFADTMHLATRRVAAASVFVPPDRLFLFYGMEGVYEGLSTISAEVLNLRTGRSERFDAPKGTGRIGATATHLYNGKILIAGGVVQRAGMADVPDAYLFDPETNRFDPIPGRMAVPRGDHAAVLLPDGRVLIAGGVALGPGTKDRQPIADIEVFDPTTNTFELLDARLPFAVSGPAAAPDGHGGAIIAGGFDQKRLHDEIVEFSASTGKVSTIGKMSKARYYFAATLLPDGRVLFTGGGLGGLAMDDSAEIWSSPTDVESTREGIAQ